MSWTNATRGTSGFTNQTQSASSSTAFLLLEDLFMILQEDGGNILIDYPTFTNEYIRGTASWTNQIES